MANDHPLKDFLRKKKLQNRVAAKALGVSVMSMSRYFSGTREMKTEYRLKVETFTKGAVTRSDIEDWQASNLRRLRRGGGRPRGLGAAAL